MTNPVRYGFVDLWDTDTHTQSNGERVKENVLIARLRLVGWWSSGKKAFPPPTAATSNRTNSCQSTIVVAKCAVTEFWNWKLRRFPVKKGYFWVRCSGEVVLFVFKIWHIPALQRHEMLHYFRNMNDFFLCYIFYRAFFSRKELRDSGIRSFRSRNIKNIWKLFSYYEIRSNFTHFLIKARVFKLS